MSPYPLQEFFSYFRQYDFFNKHSTIVGKRTSGDATTHAENIDNKIAKAWRKKSTDCFQYRVNKENRKGNRKNFFLWQPLKTRSLNFFIYRAIHKGCPYIFSDF